MLACLQQGFSTITVRAARLLNGGASCADGVVVMTRARVLAVGVVLAATLVSTGRLASAGAPGPPANFEAMKLRARVLAVSVLVAATTVVSAGQRVSAAGPAASNLLKNPRAEAKP